MDRSRPWQGEATNHVLCSSRFHGHNRDMATVVWSEGWVDIARTWHRGAADVGKDVAYVCEVVACREHTFSDAVGLAQLVKRL